MRTIADHVLDIASNSVTAGATQIWLDIDHDPADHLFVFTVRDNGCGMDADRRTRVFDPFFTTRPHSIRRFGLGLPFLQQNTELTGGGVDLWSAPGEGTLSVVPSPGALHRSTPPPVNSVFCWRNGNPRPNLLILCGRVVKNGSNTRVRLSASIPHPLSRTVKTNR